MKIWIGYGSEHSANLVIIGEFSSVQKAKEAYDLLNETARVAEDDVQAGIMDLNKPATRFTDAMLKHLTDTNLASLSYSDPEQLVYEFNAKQVGEKVIITTDEYDINAFLKILLHKEAKIQVYSAHDHGGPHGRGKRS